MDQPIYAHNKSLIESNACQKFDSSDNFQHPRTGDMQFYQPPGSLFPTTTVNSRPPWPQQPIRTQDNQFRNGTFNGFQQDLAVNASTVVPHGPPPNMLTPSNIPYMAPQVNHPDPILSNPRFSRPYLPPRPVSSTFPSAPPVAPQGQMNLPVFPSTLDNHHPPPPASRQIKGAYLGDLPISPPRSTTDSPSGSRDASRSETPVTGNLRYHDQLRNQSFASQSSQNVISPPSLHSGSQIPHALTTETTSVDSSFGPSQPKSFPQHFLPTTQQQLSQPPQQLWQQHQGPSQQQHQGPSQQQHQGPPQQLVQHPGPPQQLPYHPGPQQSWITSQSLAEEGPNQPLHQQVPWPLPTNQQNYIQTSTWQQGQGQPPRQGYDGQPWQESQVLHNQQLSWQQQQFPQSQQQPPQNHLNAVYQGLPGSFEGLNVNEERLPVSNLTQERVLVPKDGFVMNEPKLKPAYRTINCSPDIMCCTLNAIPNTSSLLQKSRLPLGVLLHPFKDLSQLVVSQMIVRCRSCRTYMNPFVDFLDPGRWRCNICHRVNDVPSFDFYGDPFKRPEFKNTSIDYIASDEYLLRPPMPAVYLYLLDVTHNAIDTGYLDLFCETLMTELDKIPGDGRTQIGFMAYDSNLYFFNLSEELSQIQLIVVSDVDDPYVPCPDGLLVNLHQGKHMVVDLLKKLPSMFKSNEATGSALGSALQFAKKMMLPSGGRISVFQSILPTIGEGSLKQRVDKSERLTKNIGCLGHATDFYKKLALECSVHHVSIDLFMLNSQYSDIASLDGMSKFTGGSLYYFPNFHVATNIAEAKRFKSILSRYLTRKIGFEAVMRIRCSKGLSIVGYHGNFFVRSTDLLCLPSVNPDSAYGVQVAIDEDLELNYVSFQAAILYTSSNAERRIRVHTLSIPVTSKQSEIEANANQLAIVGLLSKMAVDKSLNMGLGNSREAMVNTVIDIVKASSSSLSPVQKIQGQLVIPSSLKLIPLLVLALLKSTSFRIGVFTKVDDRVVAMEMFKNLPLKLLLLHLHPYLYPVHNLDEKVLCSHEGGDLIRPPIVSLSSTQVDRHGAYFMDVGSYVYFYLGPAISDLFCLNVFGVNSVGQVSEGELELPELESDISAYLRNFISKLNSDRPFYAPLILIKEVGKMKELFHQHLIEDKTESSFSYQEFLQHICKEIKQ